MFCLNLLSFAPGSEVFDTILEVEIYTVQVRAEQWVAHDNLKVEG